MGVRKVTARDVADHVYRHENVNRISSPRYGSYVLMYVLNSDSTVKDPAGARTYIRSLGYDKVADEVVDCAEKCVTFATKLNELGYRWDSNYCQFLAPKKEVECPPMDGK